MLRGPGHRSSESLKSKVMRSPSIVTTRITTGLPPSIPRCATSGAEVPTVGPTADRGPQPPFGLLEQPLGRVPDRVGTVLAAQPTDPVGARRAAPT
jgi:hypothetical protein